MRGVSCIKYPDAPRRPRYLALFDEAGRHLINGLVRALPSAAQSSCVVVD